jgi:hypothetical protein
MPFIQYKSKKILYIHIPKTGGTSIEEWMKTISPLRMFSVGIPHAVRCTPQHFRAQDIKALLGEDFFDLSIAVVRNPYDRIASEYKMRMHIEKQGFWKNGPDFSLWLEDNLSRQARDKFHLDNHLRPQWEFIGNNVEVFKLEDGLMAPLRRISEVLEIRPPEFPPHELRGLSYDFTWDITDRILVQTHYAKDFEEFGYLV